MNNTSSATATSRSTTPFEPVLSPQASTSTVIAYDKALDNMFLISFFTNTAEILAKPVLKAIPDAWLGEGFFKYIRNEKTLGECAYNALPGSTIIPTIYQKTLNLSCIATQEAPPKASLEVNQTLTANEEPQTEQISSEDDELKIIHHSHLQIKARKHKQKQLDDESKAMEQKRNEEKNQQAAAREKIRNEKRIETERIKNDKIKSADALYDHAHESESSGDWDEAMDFYDKALDSYNAIDSQLPGYSKTLLAKDQLLQKIKTKAEEEVKKGKELFNQGKVQETAKNYPEALDLFKEAVELLKEDPTLIHQISEHTVLTRKKMNAFDPGKALQEAKNKISNFFNK